MVEKFGTKGAGPFSVGNTLAAIPEGSMAPLSLSLFPCVVLYSHKARTHREAGANLVLDRKDAVYPVGPVRGRTIENVGIGNEGMGNVEFSRRGERGEESSRALPREESTRRFVRWLVSPRLATSNLYPYMLSGVIDYRGRSISKVQRSSCESQPRLPSTFVTLVLSSFMTELSYLRVNLRVSRQRYIWKVPNDRELIRATLRGIWDFMICMRIDLNFHRKKKMISQLIKMLEKKV